MAPARIHTLGKILGIIVYWNFIVLSLVNCTGMKSAIEFDIKPIAQNPLFLPISRYEASERNTSEAYKIWDEVKLKWIEWPGNVTKLDAKFPIFKWEKRRAKFIQNPCNRFLGMNLFAYAYKHIHLTFGSYRITSSYCPPLSIPRKFLPSYVNSDSTFLSVSDFAFVPNALLVIIENRFVVQVGALEISYRMEGQIVDDSKLLTYDIANGITTPIDKLVTQNCCNKFDTCKTGDVVLAYKEGSPDFIAYLSTDSGRNFEQLELLIPHSQILHAVLAFPTLAKLLVFHGNSSEVTIDTFSMENGHKLENSSQPRNSIAKQFRLEFKGKLQAAKLGQEISYLVWDACRVWYSRNEGTSLTEARFYIHSEIKNKTKHRISPKHCAFGEESTLACDDTGKIGILDSNNIFFYGIDTKSAKTFNLIAIRMDMSLMTLGTKNSIVPHFDFNNRPKLMYPAKFLKVDHPAVNRPDYKKRLAMKLFPKSLFPSDFMQPFCTENIPIEYKQEFGIKSCQSSGISADKSISQKPKVYRVSRQKAVNFELEFHSTLNSPDQLKYEPSFYSESGFLQINMKVFDAYRLGDSKRHYFKYGISISAGPHVLTGSQYRLNFHTTKSLRCIHQPQLTVWIKIVEHKSIFTKNGDELNATFADTLRVSEQYVMSGKIKSEVEDPMKISTCANRLSLKTV